MRPGPLTSSDRPATRRDTESEAPMGLGQLDDNDYPAITMGQAAELLEVQPAFLRSLDAAGVLKPQRSSGGHRRYSRRQLRLAARMRELFDQGMTLDAAVRIVGLEDELDTARARITELESPRQPPRNRAEPDAGTRPHRTDEGSQPDATLGSGGT
jgi:MerR family transcriptional regulator/heat shock protein HspR